MSALQRSLTLLSSRGCVAKPIDSVPVPEELIASCDPCRTHVFACKCGCDLFHLDVAVQTNHDWYTILRCAACGKANCPTEPITNGPH